MSISLGVTSYNAIPPVPTISSWQGLNSTSSEMINFNTASVGNNIYLIGNQGATTLIYNTVANTWSNGTAYPGGMSGPDGVQYVPESCIAIGTKIYCIQAAFYLFNPTLNIYDTVANTWSTGAVMPQNRSAFLSSSNGNIIYYIGGVVNGTVPQDMQWYDTSNNTWGYKASIGPYYSFTSGKTAIDNIIYGASNNFIYSFDTINKVFLPGTLSIPNGISLPKMVNIGDNFFTICNVFATSKKVGSYNTISQTWTTQVDFPLISNPKVDSCNGVIYGFLQGAGLMNAWKSIIV